MLTAWISLLVVKAVKLTASSTSSDEQAVITTSFAFKCYSLCTLLPLDYHRALTYWPLTDMVINLKYSFKTQVYGLMSWALLIELTLSECHRTPLLISQYWFRSWLGAVRQQAITWANIDPDPCHQMVSLGNNELTNKMLSQAAVHSKLWKQRQKYEHIS